MGGMRHVGVEITALLEVIHLQIPIHATTLQPYFVENLFRKAQTLIHRLHTGYVAILNKQSTSSHPGNPSRLSKYSCESAFSAIHTNAEFCSAQIAYGHKNSKEKLPCKISGDPNALLCDEDFW